MIQTETAYMGREGPKCSVDAAAGDKLKGRRYGVQLG